MVSIGDGIEYVIFVVIAAFVGSALLPSAISQFANTTLPGASQGVQALWGMIPLFAILGFALYFVYTAVNETDQLD